MALADDTIGDHAATLSNEVMYQKVWATFVDGVIARHRQSSPEDGGGRIELRDVMRLEEVLARIENAEGGWIDYEGRQELGAAKVIGDTDTELSSIGPAHDSLSAASERKPLETTPGLPPMFQNPGASFLASMYNTVPVHADCKDEPPPQPPSPLSVRPSLSSSSSSRGSTPIAAAHRKENTAAHAQGEAPTRLRGDGTEGMQDFRELDPEKGGEGRVEGPCCVDSISSEADVSPEKEPLTQLSARLDTTHIEDPDTGGNPCTEREEKSEGEGDPEEPLLLSPTHPVRDTNASCDAVELESSRHSIVLDDEEKRLPCTAPGEQPGGMATGVAVLDASRCTNDNDSDKCAALSDGVAAAGAATSSEANGDGHPCLPVTTTGSGNNTGSDAAAAGLIQPESEGSCRSPLQSDSEREVPAGGKRESGQQALPPGELNHAGDENVAGDEDSSLDSVARSASLSLLEESAVAARKGSNEAEASVHSGISDCSLGSPRHESRSRLESRRRQPGRGPRDHHSRSHGSCSSESPELVRRGSASRYSDGASGEEPSSDRGAWGVEIVHRRSREDALFDSDVDEKNLSRMRSMDGVSDGCRQGIGSAVSPDIGGFGECDGVDALSLSPLAGPLEADDVEDDACGEDDAGGGGSGWDATPAGDGVECGLSPVRSASSESAFDFEHGPSSPEQLREAPFFLEDEEEAGDSGDSGDVTLSPEVSRSSRVTHARSEREKGGGPGWGDSDVAVVADDVDGDLESGSLMPPPPPRRSSLAKHGYGRRHQELRAEEAFTPPRKPSMPERRRRSGSSNNPRPARPALRDRTNGWFNGGDDSRDGKSPSEAPARGHRGGGGKSSAGYNEQASIGSFTESEAGGSRLGDSFRDGCGWGDKENGDGSSLVEGTPRRRGVGSGKEDLGGYYPPLQVANTAATTAHEAWSLSTLQRSTLQWMLWRERSDEEKEGRGGAPGGGSASLAAAIDSFVSDNSSNSGAGTRVRGGVLGHLSAEEASSCVHALVKGGVASDDTRGTTSGRGGQRRCHPETGLPCGRTLILAPTKEAAWKWSDRLESGACGLSVLSYVMPLRERRRISAKQAAAFDVVVTSYDVLKAKEVPRGVDSTRATSPRRWALPGSAEWRTRSSKEERQERPAACKTDHLVSVLHGVWWDRVVADGAQILATHRSARAAAALSLVGTTRWCVVERENMAVVESNSERMRSLSAFLRVHADVPMVQAAESLFYASRPSHIAPLHPRSNSGGANNSLSLNNGVGSRSSSPGSSSQEERPRSRGSVNRDRNRRNVDGGGGGRGARSSAGGKGESAGKKGLGVSATSRNGGLVEVEGPRENGRSKKSSRTSSGGGGESPENRRCGAEGIGPAAAGGEGLSRRHVAYAATTLRLRRAGGVGGVVQFGP